MTPAVGVDRLIYFAEARIAQLNLSKEEVAVIAAPMAGHGRVLSPGSLRGRASTTPGPVMS